MSYMKLIKTEGAIKNGQSRNKGQHWVHKVKPNKTDRLNENCVIPDLASYSNKMCFPLTSDFVCLYMAVVHSNIKKFVLFVYVFNLSG